jgi:hypothetical protein
MTQEDIRQYTVNWSAVLHSLYADLDSEFLTNADLDPDLFLDPDPNPGLN